MYNNYITENQKDKALNEVIGDGALKDANKHGKDNNWRLRKIDSLNLADSYKRLKSKKYQRVKDCSNFLEFRLTTKNSLKLTRANFCKVRLCPMCGWRRSLKVFGQVSQVMNYVEENHNYKYIFLTLTVKNCEDFELRDTLDLMTKSFNKLSERKAFKDSIKGYFRALEVTYNKDSDTYHPHFHLILAVNPSYFTDSRYYISQKKWSELWKSCLKVDYDVIVDVRKFKKNNSKEIAEVAKYTVKSQDYLIKEDGKINEQLSDKVVNTLDKALHAKRLTAFGFIFKDIHKQLNLDDSDDANLVDTDSDELREDLTDIILRYQWNIGFENYILREVIQQRED